MSAAVSPHLKKLRGDIHKMVGICWNLIDPSQNSNERNHQSKYRHVGKINVSSIGHPAHI